MHVHMHVGVKVVNLAALFVQYSTLNLSKFEKIGHY